MPPPLLPRLRAAARAALVLCVCALGACAWSVPADPGLNALRRSRAGADALSAPGASDVARPAPTQVLGGAASDDGARSAYLAKCSQCHAPWPPTHATAAEWPGYVRKYGPRAGLFGAERERVLRWLQANAR